MFCQDFGHFSSYYSDCSVEEFFMVRLSPVPSACLASSCSFGLECLAKMSALSDIVSLFLFRVLSLWAVGSLCELWLRFWISWFTWIKTHINNINKTFIYDIYIFLLLSRLKLEALCLKPLVFHFASFKNFSSFYDHVSIWDVSSLSEFQREGEGTQWGVRMNESDWLF